MTEPSDKIPLRLDDLDELTLKASEAFLAMGRFLSEYAERLSPETALVTIRSAIEIEKDGMSGDPAALTDWLQCVQAVSGEDSEPPKDALG
jgi:hypothetical protein